MAAEYKSIASVTDTETGYIIKVTAVRYTEGGPIEYRYDVFMPEGGTSIDCNESVMFLPDGSGPYLGFDVAS